MTLKHFARTLSLSAAAAVMVAAAGSAQAGNDHSSVQGMVKGANGQPVAGAFVRVRGTDNRLTFMVISQDKGEFNAGELPAGSYTVQAIGGEMQSAISQPVKVGAGAA